MHSYESRFLQQDGSDGRLPRSFFETLEREYSDLRVPDDEGYWQTFQIFVVAVALGLALVEVLQ